jgi:hypothetical protein
MTSLACTTLERPTGVTGEVLPAEGPGSVFFTVEEAALDAMAYAHTKRFPAGRPDLLAGTIHRVDGGFSYAPPTASDRHSALSPSTTRIRLAPDDVASYLVYTKRNNRQIDRRNETLSRKTRRIVDEVDPMRRPIYLLTPSLNVVTYDGGQPQSIARLDAPRSTTVAASER